MTALQSLIKTFLLETHMGPYGEFYPHVVCVIHPKLNGQNKYQELYQ